MTREQAYLQYAATVVRMSQRGGCILGWTPEEIFDAFAMCRHPGVSFPEWCQRMEIAIDEVSKEDGQALVDATAEAWLKGGDPSVSVEGKPDAE